MAWTKIHNHGVEKLPEEFMCASTDIKPTDDIVEGSTVWEYDTKTGYVFADGDWREV
jgi:hypothetical protein